MDGITTLILMGGGMLLILAIITMVTQNYNLNGIRDRTVGHGQHGTARWATAQEIRRTFCHVPFTPARWREDAKRGIKPTADKKLLPQGIILGCKGTKKITAIVDADDVHVLMIGASGIGKTAFFLYPNLEYACASGRSFLALFSAGRSRRLSLIPIIQRLAQLEKNYSTEGAEILQDNCQDTIFGGFAPNSQTAETLSKNLGNRTVLSGQVTRSQESPSQSLQMMQRPLMTADELKSMPKGNFVVMKTGSHPMRVKLRLFFEWGVQFERPLVMPDRGSRPVHYASKQDLEAAIPTISRDLKLSESTTRRALRDLRHAGLIKTKLRYRDNGGNSSLRYFLV